MITADVRMLGRMRGGLGMGLSDRKTLMVRADGRVQTTAFLPVTGLRRTAVITGKGGRKAVSSDASPPPRDRSGVPPCPPLAGTPPLTFKGHHATVTVWPERVEIDRTFLGRINGNHSVSIPWQRVAGIDFADPARLIDGYAHFAIESGLRGLTAASRGRRGAAMARNPHAIMFTWRQRATYERLRDLLTGN
jgi:hypothetical protein